MSIKKPPIEICPFWKLGKFKLVLSLGNGRWNWSHVAGCLCAWGKTHHNHLIDVNIYFLCFYALSLTPCHHPLSQTQSEIWQDETFIKPMNECRYARARFVWVLEREIEKYTYHIINHMVIEIGRKWNAKWVRVEEHFKYLNFQHFDFCCNCNHI